MSRGFVTESGTVTRLADIAVSAAAELTTDLQEWLGRTAYLTQHRVLAASTAPARMLWQTALQPRTGRPDAGSVRVLARRFERLLAQDVENARAGYYPRELLFEFPLAEYLAAWPAALVEFPRVWWRRLRSAHDELPATVVHDGYPSYYLRTFHWQSDGWLSDRSARLYDPGVEFLFGGTADVMRRMAIPPVVDAVRGRRRPRILDVGCGTGRFLRQLGRALPDARLYGLDLSTFYLRRAHDVAAGTAGELSLVAENAESMPFADGFFDAVTSIYLFHELPRGARRRVMAEMVRVVRPGGVVAICDSAQLADSAELSDVLEAFPRSYHEPYYKSYLRDDLAAIARESGLGVQASEPHLVSRVVSARRSAARARPSGRRQAKSQRPRTVRTK